MQKMSPSTTGRCYQTREWGQPTNRSVARRHGSQSHGFAVRVWSNLCICSPGVVELVKSNLAPDFPLFHGVLTTDVPQAKPCLSQIYNRESKKSPFPCILIHMIKKASVGLAGLVIAQNKNLSIGRCCDLMMDAVNNIPSSTLRQHGVAFRS